MTNLGTILKSWDITLLTKVCAVKAMVFPVVKYGCENWTIKKAEHQRIDAFKLWCWRRFFESPLDSKEIQAVNPTGNQPWIFIGRTDAPSRSISPSNEGAEAEAPMLWPLDSKSRLIRKDPMLGKTEGRRRRGRQRMRWLDGITDAMDMRLSKPWTGRLDVLQSTGSQRVRRDWVTEQQPL